MRHLLLSGGPGHDFDATSAVVAALLAEVGVETTIVHEPADAIEALRSAERGDQPAWDLLTVNALRWRMAVERYAHLRDRYAVVLDDNAAQVLERHVSSGGGLLALHTAVICFDAHPTWRELVGAAWVWDRSSHPLLGSVDIAPTHAGRDHTVTAGIAPFSIVDELYGDLDVDEELVPLLVGAREDSSHPVLWARTHGQGRVVTDLLGHGTDSLAHPTHRALLLRAAKWAARSSHATTHDSDLTRHGTTPA